MNEQILQRALQNDNIGVRGLHVKQFGAALIVGPELTLEMPAARITREHHRHVRTLLGEGDRRPDQPVHAATALVGGVDQDASHAGYSG